MKFAKKLRRLTAKRNRVELAGEIGVSQSSIYGYMKDSIPTADVGLKLAKALDCDPHWLFDDAAPWPPVSVAESLSCMELWCAQRARVKQLADQLAPAMKAILDLPWGEYAKALDTTQPASSVRATESYKAVRLARLVWGLPSTPHGKMLRLDRDCPEVGEFEGVAKSVFDQLTATSGGTEALVRAAQVGVDDGVIDEITRLANELTAMVAARARKGGAA